MTLNNNRDREAVELKQAGPVVYVIMDKFWQGGSSDDVRFLGVASSKAIARAVCLARGVDACFIETSVDSINPEHFDILGSEYAECPALGLQFSDGQVDTCGGCWIPVEAVE
jgi:hypothetical protein